MVGDDEYRSEITMPLMAKILEEQHGFKCSMTYAVVPETGEKIPQYRQYIEGLEALKTADLAIFYLRFRRLPDDQMDLILNYVKSGKPIIGFRTTTHAFRFPEGHKYRNLNSDFGIDVFGQKWISHPGGSTRFSRSDNRQGPESRDGSPFGGRDRGLGRRSAAGWPLHAYPARPGGICAGLQRNHQRFDRRVPGT